jgi:adenylylsulfate kinase
VIIAMAGLPATGKSTLARRLAAELPAILLDKDAVRAALFPGPETDYSTAQDDLCVDVMLQVARYTLRRRPHRAVLLDGRPFTRRYQVEALKRAAAGMGAELRIIECICSDDTARARLARDIARGLHPAENRNFALYQRLKDEAEPIEEPKLVVDTGEVAPEPAVRQCIAFLTSGR